MLFFVMVLLVLLIGVCGAYYLLFKASDVLKEHKEAIEKNRSAIELLAHRYDEEGETNE